VTSSWIFIHTELRCTVNHTSDYCVILPPYTIVPRSVRHLLRATWE